MGTRGGGEGGGGGAGRGGGRGRGGAAGGRPSKRRRLETEEEEWARAAKHTDAMDRHTRRRQPPKAGQLDQDSLDKYMASIDGQIADDMRRSASRGVGGCCRGQGDRFDLDDDDVAGVGEHGSQSRIFRGAIPVDTRCAVVSKPGMEGRTGRVVDWDESNREYTLLLDAGDEDFVRLARANVQQLVEGVAVVGLKSRADLNGRVGRVLGFDRAAVRYRVSLRPGKRGRERGEDVEVAVKPENLVFPKGTRVELVGLQKTKEHNGKWGTITEYSERDGRYTVCVSDDLSLRPKLANCRA